MTTTRTSQAAATQNGNQIVEIIEKRFVTDEGLVAVPVAGDDSRDTEVSIVRLHSPFTILQIQWQAQNEGAFPAIPSAQSLNDDVNYVLLRSEISPASAMPMQSGKKVYAVSGTYWYAKKKPRAVDDTIPLPKVSLDQDQKETVSKDKYKDLT